MLNARAEASLLEWIPINSRICAVRLATNVGTDSISQNKRCLFVVATYAPTDCSSLDVKDAFYTELDALLRRSKSSDIVLLAGDMNAQLGRLDSSESELGGGFGLEAQRTDNGERLLHLCAEHRLFVSSTAFRHKKCQCATWRPPSAGQPWSQIDHIAVSARWKGCIQACRSYWNTYVDSDHALVRCDFVLRFPSNRQYQTKRLALEKLGAPAVRKAYQSCLSNALLDASQNDVAQVWGTISNAMHAAAASACGDVGTLHRAHWISDRSVDLLERRRQIPPGPQHNQTRRHIRRELKRSLRSDREAWWTKKAEEMEAASNLGDARRLYQLIRSTGPKNISVSETINERDGTLICNQQRRLARWAEHFQEQFSWPPATSTLLDVPQAETWSVDLQPPTEAEIRNCISSMKRYKAAGPDNLPPVLFKEGGDALFAELARLFRIVWETERVPDSWGESVVIPIFKKGTRNECSNHRGISLTPVITRILASICVKRLTPFRETQIREEQAGFRPGRGCIDQIFTLRQILEQRHCYRQPTIAVFLDFKGAFDSVDRNALFSTLLCKGVPLKYVNVLRALYAHTSGRVRVYGRLSPNFATASGVRQGCPISPFLFNFVIDVLMETCIKAAPTAGVHVLPGSKVLDLDYADDIVLLFDSHADAQLTLNTLSSLVPSFGMRFAPSKCKVLLQDVDQPGVPLSLNNEELQVVDRFTYLGSCISSNATLKEEISARISRAMVIFRNLGHLWRQKGISLRLKGRVYKTTVRAVLLYGCETWTLRAEDLKRLQVFDSRCLRSIACIGWNNRIRNVTVRHRVLGSDLDIEKQINASKLRWLGHTLRMCDRRLPNRVLFASPSLEWRKVRGGQALTWHRQMKALTSKLASVGSVRLPGWGPRDSPCEWLRTLQDMARDRSQWRSCCSHLLGMSD